MSLIQCPECGKEISDHAEKCPNCGYPINGNGAEQIHNQSTYVHPVTVRAYNQKPKQSTLGLIALLLSLLGCTFWLGAILAIIDLRKKDDKKKTGSIAALVFSGIYLLAICFAVVNKDSDTSQNSNSTQYISSEVQETVSDKTNTEVKSDDKEEKTDYIEITSTDLIDAYNENQVKCKQMYDGKKLKVSGTVKSVGTDIMDDVYVCLDHDTEMVFVGIQCYAKDESTENQIAELQEGDFITVVGDGECGSMSFSLRNTEIVEVSSVGNQDENSDEETSADNDITTGQRNALKSAKDYLDFEAFSYNGLIEQLEYEQYSHEDAVYAADNCGADWNEQAVKSAESYLNFTSFSKDGLIEQLEYEGFTHEQAVYGAEQNGY